MNTKRSFESWKEDLTNRAEDAVNQKGSSPEDVVTQLEGEAKNDKFKKESLAKAAADLKLVENDPIARELYDAWNDSRVPMFDLLDRIDALIPENENVSELNAERYRISMEAQKGHYRDGEMGTLQRQLRDATNIERKDWQAWTEYAAEHSAAFLGDPESGEDDFFEATSAEEIRQKKRTKAK